MVALMDVWLVESSVLSMDDLLVDLKADKMVVN